MGFNVFNLFGERRSIENPSVPVSSNSLLELFGMGGATAAGVNVTVEKALGVPSVFSAVNFLSGTMASLPIKIYQKGAGGRKEIGGRLAAVLSRVPNPGCSSFQWRKHLFDQVFTTGRSFTFIERNPQRRINNLWPLDPSKVEIIRKDGVVKYKYRDGGKKKPDIYGADEILDVPFMLKPNMLTHYSPLMTCRNAIGAQIAAVEYGGKFFNNGGVPPFAIEGPFNSPGGIERSASDLDRAVKTAAQKKRLALSIPAGHKIHELGGKPKDNQLVDLQRFQIEEIARIYSLPPTFLQDLTHGTFSNTEQQDLHFVKHTLRRWVRQFEQELNLKLFGRVETKRYVEMNLDALLRGDFKTRMDGYAQAVQNALMTPNEARSGLNLPSQAGGDELYIQGATVPLGSQMELPLSKQSDE